MSDTNDDTLTITDPGIDVRVDASITHLLDFGGATLWLIRDDGEVERDGEVVTDDDAALAQCFRDWAEVHGLTVRPKKLLSEDDDLDEELPTPQACNIDDGPCDGCQ